VGRIRGEYCATTSTFPTDYVGQDSLVMDKTCGTYGIESVRSILYALSDLVRLEVEVGLQELDFGGILQDCNLIFT
jgi:hypothetical protein